MENFSKSELSKKLNKGISAPIGILVITAVAIVSCVFVLWQYFEIQKEKIELIETEKLEKSKFGMEIIEEEFAEIPLFHIEEGENKIGKIKIQGIKVSEKGELPSEIEIEPAYPDRVDSGYCLLYKEEEMFCSDHSGMFADWMTFDHNDYKYILPLEKNTGTYGPSLSSVLYVFNQETLELKELDSSSIEKYGISFSFYEFAVFLYQDYLYALLFDQGQGGCCFLSESIRIFSLIEDSFIDKKSFNGIYYRCANPPLEISVSEGDVFIEKNNKLYIKIENQYVYELAYPKKELFEDVYIYWGAVPNFYLLDNGRFKESSKDFKFVYLNNAKKYDDILETERWKEFSETVEINFLGNNVYAAGPPPESEFDTTHDWLSPLLGRTLNLIFADESVKAWKMFDEDFVILSAQYPLPGQREIDPIQIKKEIQQDLIKSR